MRRLSYILLAAGVLFLVVSGGWAQTETGQITGVVADPQGGTVAGAKIQVKNVATGAVRDVESDEHGSYTVPSLLPAVYEVTVEATGFSKLVRQIDVPVGTKVTLNLQVSLGSSATVVEVTAGGAAQVNVESQTLGGVISAQQVGNLPTLNANPYTFVSLVGNVADTDASPSGPISILAANTGAGAGVVINGLRSSSTNVLLDGAANNDEFGGHVGQQVPLESVQEFSVLTNNFTAEYGRATAGIVNVATKPGTNNLHGSAYEINRLSAYGANDFFNKANGVSRPVYTRNQFGGSLGGPIKKDKMFFFASPEWTRIRSSATTVAVIPDNNLINASDAGTTQAFFNAFGQLRPSLQLVRTFSRADFASTPNPTPPPNFIKHGLDAACEASAACNAAFPDASDTVLNSTPLFDQVTYSSPGDAGGGSPGNTYDFVVRYDYNISDKTQFYARYAKFHEQDALGVVNNSPYSGPSALGFDTGQTFDDHSGLLSLLHTVGPRLTEQTKFVFNRLGFVQPLGKNPVGPTLYWNKNAATTFAGQALALPGYSQLTPGGAIPFGGPQNFYQTYQDFTYVKAKHDFRFGGSYLFFQDDRTFGAYEEAVESLGTGGVNGGALQNLLTGNLKTFTVAIDPQGKFPCGHPGLSGNDPIAVTPNCTVTLPANQPNFSRSNRYSEFAFYGQDTWKARPHLTINLGLRWEYFGVQHNKNPRLDSNFYPAVGGSIFDGIRNGDVALSQQSAVHGLWGKNWNNFAPRVGFAWDIFGDGKTSLRGGYGIGYERNFGNVTFNVIQNVPNYEVVDLTGGVDPGCCTVTTSNLGGFSGTGTKTLPRASLRFVDPHIRTSYAHLYDAALEHQLSSKILLGLEYSGSKGEGLYTLDPINRLGSGNVYLGDPCTPGACTSRIRGQQYSTINARENGGFSSYNAANVRLVFSNPWNSGLNLTANYTYAHAIDNLSTTFSTGGTDLNLGQLDPFNPKLDRGDAEFDLRHRIALGGTWDVPLGRSSHGVFKQVAGGWTLSSIFVAHTGTPFTIFDSTNTEFQQIPRLILTSAISRTGSPVDSGLPDTFNYISIPNSSVTQFTNPITGNSDFGPYPSNMTGRDSFRGPGTWNFDFGVHKKFFINERYNLEFRADSFDILNHANAYIIGGSNDFGAAFGGLAANTTVGAQTCKGTCIFSGPIPLTGAPQHRNLQLELRFAF